ncbi:MAG: RdgB/HAM1 family non-canonical purine NTP pyrophosphatase [Paludibacteraceae bacterium]|nr:RdgB/HAM1 family non-canonical purine NTP pyrophosphatase [Paludibacteraceae bacterium]
MRLVFASNNAHKLAEVREMMPAGIEILSLHEIGFEQEIAETGSTLEENSLIKAQTVWNHVPKDIDGVFADDTGLEIDALDGAPGVFTARWYSIPDSTGQCTVRTGTLPEQEIFRLNRLKALRELEGKQNRECRFRTVITLLTGKPETIQVEGVVRGRIAEEEHGKGGFGYDPVFIPDGYDKTFGELPAELKNTISHRAKALEELVKLLDC